MSRDPQREDCARFVFVTTVQAADLLIQLAGYGMEDGELVYHPDQRHSIFGVKVHSADVGGMEESACLHDLAASLDITLSQSAAASLLAYVKQQEQAGGRKTS